MAGSDNFGYRTNKIITSSPESDNVVHHINTFIASSLAFGWHVSFHRGIFDLGYLFLNTVVIDNLKDHNMYLSIVNLGSSSDSIIRS